MKELREAYEAVRALAHTCLRCSDAATHANLGAVVGGIEGDWYFCDRHAAAHGAPELPYAAAIRAATSGVMTPRAQVFADVDAERTRQDEKWGEQNHPDVDPVLIGRAGGCSVQRMAEELGVPTADCARAACDSESKLGRCTWSLIAVEEVAETVEAATLAAQGKCEVSAVRAELVQTAAVFVSWIEAVDRRATRKGGAT